MANNRNNSGGNRNDDRDQRNEQALTVVQPARLPFPADVANEVGCTAGEWKALVDAVFVSAKSVDGVMLALRYCKARNLDPFKRVVHVVPMYNAKLGREVETVWPGIAEMRTTATRTGQHAGNDECVFGRTVRQGFHQSVRKKKRNDEPYDVAASCPEFDWPEWAQLTVYKIVTGQRVKFVGPKVRFLEIFSGVKGLRVPNDRWRQAPFQMLEKCAEAAALRRAFPEELGDEWTAEEMEGKILHAEGEDPASAAYVEVNPADEPAAEETGGGQSDQGDAGRDMRGWHQDKLDDYMSFIRSGFAMVKSIVKVEKAIAGEREMIESLPADEAHEVEVIIAEARRRIEAARSDKQPDQGDGQQSAREDIQDADFQPEPEEPPYVRNLRIRIDECDSLPDLNRLEAAENRTMATQTKDNVEAAKRMIADRRAQMTGSASE